MAYAVPKTTLRAFQARTWKFSGWVTMSGAARDLTLDTLTFKAAPADTLTTTITETSSAGITKDSLGNVSITVSATDTATANGTYQWELILTDGSTGELYQVAWGDLEVTATDS